MQHKKGKSEHKVNTNATCQSTNISDKNTLKQDKWKQTTGEGKQLHSSPNNQ